MSTELLPILWGQEPTDADWRALAAARVSLGLETLVRPARALPGSPGRILAIGATPNWVCDYAYIEDTSNARALKTRLEYCLGLSDTHSADQDEQTTEQLSLWMGVPVKFIGTEIKESTVRFE